MTEASTSHFPTYDGNGNISEYLDSTGAAAAHYEYDPFGRTTVSTGTKWGDFAHRFSTKPIDYPTGLYYYGYRWFDPATGRWPSRDPIEEAGGINLYGLVDKGPPNHFDLLGKEKCAPSEFGRRDYRTFVHTDLYDEGEALLDVVVEILDASGLNLSLVTAVSYTGEVEVKVQECKCTKAASRGIGWLKFEDATYEWVDERIVGRRDITGGDAWFKDTYTPAHWDSYVKDATRIAEEIIAAD